MAHGFQIVPIPIEMFGPFLAMTDAELRLHGARRLVADEKPGFPCRVSLVDADPGETVLLLPFVHHDVNSPYRASGPIFVREAAGTARPEPGEIPMVLRARLISVRAYDAEAMLVGSDVVEGRDLAPRIQRFFEERNVQYLHLHNARPGCYSCMADRVP